MTKPIVCVLVLLAVLGQNALAWGGIFSGDPLRVQIRRPDRVKASIPVDNTQGIEELQGKMILAFYENGYLTGITAGRERRIPPGTAENAVMTAAVPQGTGTYTARAYFWEGLHTMKPLHEEKLEYTGEKTPAQDIPQKEKILYEELAADFRYLWQEANQDPASPGYGLVRDYVSRDEPERDRNYASIAAVGFALAALPVGVEQGWITEQQGYDRALGTLKTFRDNVPQVKGFFYHFLDMDTAQLYYEEVEISTIDTALLLAGALVCGEYFGGEVQQVFDGVYGRVDWEFMMRRAETDKNGLFYMAAKEHTDGETGMEYIERFGWWDTPAEQFILYALAAGAPDSRFRVSGDVFYNIDRYPGGYGGYTFVPSWSNGMFHYQFSHAFLDLRNTRDRLGVDWFENAKTAALVNRRYCMDNPEGSKTYGENSWGLSACYTYEGYKGSLAAAPSAYINLEKEIYGQNNGTVPLYGAAACIPYLPEEALSAMNFYRSYTEDGENKLWDGEYGFIESYNLDREQEDQRFIRRFYGLNKGITCLQIANYLDGTVWEYFMASPYIQQGLASMGIEKKEAGK